MIRAVLNYLKSDSELTTLLQATPSNSKIYLLEHWNLDDDPYIVYNYHPVIADVTTQYRVEFRVISKTYSNTEAIGKAIMRLMNFIRKAGFVSNGETIFHSTYVGGGLLKDPDDKTYQQFLFFNVKSN